MRTADRHTRLADRRGTWLPLMAELRQVFDDMDRAYRHTAAACGFVCSGCRDNCCQSHFYHHTLLEYLWLYEGYRRCPSPAQKAIRFRAQAMGDGRSAAEDKAPLDRMCPLNRKGRCRLYAYRPMICRLHGIPYILRRPGKSLLKGPGCGAFEKCRPAEKNVLLDRTPFYRTMAALESRLRRALGMNVRIRMTVAQMVVSFEQRNL